MTSFAHSNQDEAIDSVIAASLQEQHAKGPDLRQMHAKSHGLVWGELIVERDLPDALKVGLFAGDRYPVWIRFSNASPPEKRGKLKSDHEPDVRAASLKVLNVDGEKALTDEAHTQDFLLLNHPVFFVHDAQGYVDLAKAGSGQADAELLQSLQPTFAILQVMTSKTVTNPLHIQYWSTTPFKLGTQAIKFSLKPPQTELPASNRVLNSENFLREAIVASLAQDDATFDFLVQLYVDEQKTPIEDPTQEWLETDAPFVKVATVHIPSQAFDFEERQRLDEGLAFNPWHTLPEHEPLGAVNLSRKRIYQELVTARREQIQTRLREPQPHSAIHDDPQ